MQQNLALDGGRTLHSTDSNVTADVTLPANITNGTASSATSMQIINNVSGYDGNPYNWCAAIAYGNCSSITTEPVTDICPRNWRLPSYSGNPSYYNLFDRYGITSLGTIAAKVSAVQSNPIYITKSLHYNSQIITFQDRGDYQIRTPYNSAESYRFGIGTGSGAEFNLLDNHAGKQYGYSIRCTTRD